MSKEKTLKEKLKMAVDDVSDLLKHGIQGSVEKTKKKYGDRENKSIGGLISGKPKLAKKGWK